MGTQRLAQHCRHDFLNFNSFVGKQEHKKTNLEAYAETRGRHSEISSVRLPLPSLTYTFNYSVQVMSLKIKRSLNICNHPTGQPSQYVAAHNADTCPRGCSLRAVYRAISR